MQETIFLMGSITNAMRGKTLLEQHGYRAFLQRNTAPDRAGCGYVLLVRGDPQAAQTLLSRHGVALRGTRRGGAP